MGTILGNTLAFIVAISILVAVHEYGHYIVGRWCGMKVLRFSIGFGKPIWQKTAGPDQTEYCISSIPLGGYVRFLDSREGPVDPEDEGRAFNQRPVPQRIAVLLAGPFFNFFFAILAYWALFIYGIQTPVPAVGPVEPGSYAEEAGLKEGDKIVAVNGRATPDWEATLLGILDQLVSEGRIDLTLEAPGDSPRSASIVVREPPSTFTEPGVLLDKLGFENWQFPADVAELTEGGAAEAAGIRVGDRVVAIDGEDVPHFGALRAAVTPKAGQTVAVDVIRGDSGARETVTATLGSNASAGVLGIRGSDEYFYKRQFGVVESVGKAVDRTWSLSITTLKMLGRMVTGDVSIKNISGPINIAQFAGLSAERGLDYFVGFLAIVSISLGVLNLLPIPVLDGGQIVYQSVELVTGNPLSERAQILGQQVGVFALILLMSFAFYNDLARILG